MSRGPIETLDDDARAPDECETPLQGARSGDALAAPLKQQRYSTRDMAAALVRGALPFRQALASSSSLRTFSASATAASSDSKGKGILGVRAAL